MKITIPANLQPIYDFKTEDVLNTLNKINSADVKLEQIKISNPIKADATWVKENGNGDTIIYITAIPGKKLSGRVRATYSRVDINMMMCQVGNFLSIPSDVTSVYETLPWILKRYGIKLYEDDFVDGDVTWETIQPPTPEAVEGQPAPVKPDPIKRASFTLTSKENSYIYFGSAEISVTESPKTLDDLVVSDKIHDFKQMLINKADVTVLDVLTYGMDASYDYDKLKGITPENYDPEAFLKLLTDANGAWTNSNLFNKFKVNVKSEVNPEEASDGKVSDVPLEEVYDGKVNLSELKLSYNGLNSGIDCTRKKFKFVLVLSPKDDASKYVGNLYFHYNDVNHLEEGE